MPDLDPTPIVKGLAEVVDLVQIGAQFRRQFGAGEGENTVYKLAFLNSEPGVIGPDADHIFAVVMGFRCIAVPEGKDAAAVAKRLGESEPIEDLRFFCEGMFQARYRLKPDAEATPEALDAFARINVPVHLVPYWREFLDSCGRRAGMPPIAAPVFKVDGR